MTSLRTWPPSVAGAAVHARRRPLPFPLEEPGVRLFAQARQALVACLPALGLQPGDEVLVPDYHHGSEVEALLRAGLVCRWYRVGEDLAPDAAELRALTGPRTRALHLVHYLGFPQDVQRWREFCDDAGLLLVEDAAQAWLAETADGPVGRHADLAVFCLYKTFGLPDGAAATARVALPEPARGRTGLLDLARPALHQLRRHVPGGAGPRSIDPLRDVAVPDVARGATAATRWLLPRAADRGAAGARRRTYTRLLEELDHLVAEPWSALPPGASPFAFPVAVEDKVTALAHLRAQGVEPLDLWAWPHRALPAAPGSVASRLRASVIGLPVHQGMDERRLARLVLAAKGLQPLAAAGVR